MATAVQPRIPDGFPVERVGDICRHRGISRLDLFGSRALEEPHAGSDFDFLYELADPFAWTMADLEDTTSEFERLFGTKVDLVSRTAIEMSTNPYKRKNILDGCVNVHRS